MVDVLHTLYYWLSHLLWDTSSSVVESLSINNSHSFPYLMDDPEWFYDSHDKLSNPFFKVRFKSLVGLGIPKNSPATSWLHQFLIKGASLAAKVKQKKFFEAERLLRCLRHEELEVWLNRPFWAFTFPIGRNVWKVCIDDILLHTASSSLF